MPGSELESASAGLAVLAHGLLLRGRALPPCVLAHDVESVMRLCEEHRLGGIPGVRDADCVGCVFDRVRADTWSCAAGMAELALDSIARGDIEDAKMWLGIIQAGKGEPVKVETAK